MSDQIALELSEDVCEVCGPGPYFHSVCHVSEYHFQGCGHSLDDHAESLRCRVCGVECGIFCERTKGMP